MFIITRTGLTLLRFLLHFCPFLFSLNLEDISENEIELHGSESL